MDPKGYLSGTQKVLSDTQKMAGAISSLETKLFSIGGGAITAAVAGISALTARIRWRRGLCGESFGRI
jgi:hypothetical protein